MNLNSKFDSQIDLALRAPTLNYILKNFWIKLKQIIKVNAAAIQYLGGGITLNTMLGMF